MHYLDIIYQIKARRSELRVTQDMLAELSGVGLRTIKEMERGKGNPTIQSVEKILTVLGLEWRLQVKKMDSL